MPLVEVLPVATDAICIPRRVRYARAIVYLTNILYSFPGRKYGGTNIFPYPTKISIHDLAERRS